MADLVPTISDVRPIGNTIRYKWVIAGETVDRFDVVYKRTSDQKRLKASCDVSDDVAIVEGIVLTPGDDGDYILIMSVGVVDSGGVIVVAQEYVLSATPGKIAPRSDLVSTNRYRRIGYGSTASQLTLDIDNTGLLVP